MQEIRDALASLSKDNDDHWTEEGHPVVNAISSRVGRKVTRQEIVDAAPDFEREKMELPDGAEEAAAKAKIEAEEADAKSVLLKNELGEFDKELSALDQQISALREEREAVRIKREAVANEFGKANSAESHQRRIQDFIRSNNERRMAAAMAAKEAQKALGGVSLDHRSPIDRALQQKKKTPRPPRNMGV